MIRRRRSPVAVTLAILIAGMLAGPVGAEPMPRATTGTPRSRCRTHGRPGRLATVTSGLSSPIGVVNAGDGTNRLFVVQQRGTVRVVDGSSLAGRPSSTSAPCPAASRPVASAGCSASPSTQTSSRTASCSCTTPAGRRRPRDRRVDRQRGAHVASRSTLDPSSTRSSTPHSNHNGGQLAVRPRRLPLHLHRRRRQRGRSRRERARTSTRRLGKILRMTPDLNGAYDIPSGNPFVGDGRHDEIWAHRPAQPVARLVRPRHRRSSGSPMSARAAGRRSTASRRPAGGRNYGWDCREGTARLRGRGPCTGRRSRTRWRSTRTASGNCSVTGGYVYRGDVFRDFVGQYVLGDYCSGQIWTIRRARQPSLLFHRDTTRPDHVVRRVRERRALHDRSRRPPLPRRGAAVQRHRRTRAHRRHHCGSTTRASPAAAAAAAYCPDGLGHPRADGELPRSGARPAGHREDFFTDDDGPPHEGDINRVAAAGITGGCDAQPATARTTR